MAMMVKSIDEIATEELKKIIDIAITAICDRTMMAAQAEKENGATRREKLPDKSRQPTPPMMRRAIEKAFALETKDSQGYQKRVFNNKKKWLAVLRVIQYFGIVEGSNHYQRAVDYIKKKVYSERVPMPEEMQKIIPNTNALSVAGSENGLNKPLEDWLSGKYDEQLGDYLPIARCILESITDESLSYPPKA